MKGATKIKENKNSTARDWKDEEKKKEKSLGAVYEGKSGVKYNEKGNRKGKTGKQNMYGETKADERKRRAGVHPGECIRETETKNRRKKDGQ